MRISVVGTGYVGLVTGACLAELGHDVVCVDIDPGKVEAINRGVSPIHERGLTELLQRNTGTRLAATTELRSAVHGSDLSLIAVGTPFDGARIDLEYVRRASREIGSALRDKGCYHVVAVKSTVVPGTTDEVVLPILAEASGKEPGSGFGVGMNPEFLREGEAVEDFMNPDRIVLGGLDDRTHGVLEELYAVFPDVTVIKTSNKTAEMIKYTANSLLATMISFSNEIANFCAASGDVDVVEVMRGVHLDKRLTPITPAGGRVVPAFTTYLEAGCGFGGSCFPKDVRALVAEGKRAGSEMRLLDSVMAINESQPRQVLRLVEKHYPTLRGTRLAVLGLAFKPETDDMRESPAIPVIQALLARGAAVSAFDPVARREAERVLGNGEIRYCDDLSSAVAEAEVVVLMTRWKEFERLPELLADRDPQPLVVDGRRMLDKTRFARYEGIGL